MEKTLYEELVTLLTKIDESLEIARQARDSLQKVTQDKSLRSAIQSIKTYGDLRNVNNTSKF